MTEKTAVLLPVVEENLRLVRSKILSENWKKKSRELNCESSCKLHWMHNKIF
jgi:hypothetical protein